MNRDKFDAIVQEALDSLPQEFRKRLQNVVVLVEDFPSTQLMSRRRPRPR
jgi:predicted Zn-dependent protease with MMP-like domain